MMNSNDRYSRQIQTFDLGEGGQSHLAQSKVTIVGAGGLGFAVAAQLAGAGVGEISIIDFDIISLSNLHRQWLYTEADIAQPKAKVLQEHLLKLNSEISCNAHIAKLAPDNIDQLVLESDLIIDTADNFAVSYMLSDHTKKLAVPLLGASVNRHYGYISFFNTENSPSFRIAFPKVHSSETSCDLVGVSGPTVMVVAGIQAQAALDFLSRQQGNVDGSLVYIDLNSNRLDQISYSHNKEKQESEIEIISAAQVTKNDWVIDVRSDEETQNAPFSFEVHQQIKGSDLERDHKSLPKGKRLVTACKSGQRALIAAQKLHDLGFDQTAVLLSSNE